MKYKENYLRSKLKNLDLNNVKDFSKFKKVYNTELDNGLHDILADKIRTYGIYQPTFGISENPENWEYKNILDMQDIEELKTNMSELGVGVTKLYLKHCNRNREANIDTFYQGTLSGLKTALSLLNPKDSLYLKLKSTSDIYENLKNYNSSKY